MRSWRFWITVGLFLAVNVTGWVMVRREVIRGSDQVRRAARLVQSLPRTDVGRADRLSLLFDSPVASADIVGKPLSQCPLKFLPEVEGVCVWTDPQRLDFLPEKPLPAGRSIRLMPAADLELQTGRAVEKFDVAFETEGLILEACELLSADREHVNVELVFNQPVAIDGLLKSLKAEAVDPNAGSEYVLTTSSPLHEPSRRPIVRLQRPLTRQVRLTLDKSLTGSEGTKALAQAAVRTVGLPVVEAPAQPIAAKADEPARGKPAPLKLPFRVVRPWISPPGVTEAIEVRLFFSLNFRQDQPVPQVQLSPPVEGLVVRFGRHYETEYPTLVLEGAFQTGTKYVAQVAPTLIADDGTPLDAGAAVPFTIPEREPTVEFVDGEGILTPHGNLQLDLRTVQVSQLRLAASRVHANNLVAHLQGEYRRRTSRPLAEKVVTLDESQKVKRRTLDLKPLFDKPTGIYQIEARAEDEAWTADWSTVTVTDLALTVKRERNGLWAWVTSLRTAQPVAGAKVSAVTYTNQTMGTAVTDAQGIARLSLPSEVDGPPWVVVAELQDDLAYLRLDASSWSLDGVDQAGRVIPTTYDVLLYPERGVYRPGDIIHLTGVLRDVEGNVPPAFPLTVSVVRPDGRQVAELPITPDAALQGLFHVDFPTHVDAQTGGYRFQASLPGDKVVLGSTSVLVEAFLPVRIEVQAEPVEALVLPGQTPQLDVAARYLFGQPAADLLLTHVGWYQRIPLKPRGVDQGYVFGSESSTRYPLEQGSSTLDDAGRAQIPVALKEKLGLYRLDVTSTVTETGGRSVSKTASMLVDTVGRHVGLKGPGPVVPVDQPLNVDWIVRDGMGLPVDRGPIELKLVRVEYESILRRWNGNTTWESSERLIPLRQETVQPTAKKSDEAAPGPDGSLSLACPLPGHHRLTVVDTRSGSETAVEFYATTGRGEQVSASLGQPDRLTLTLDRPQYLPGDTARVVVTSPFAGTLHLCLETDRVLEQRLVEMKENSIAVEIPVPVTVRGGAFVTASVVRAIDPARSQWLPHRAQGMTRLATDHSSHRLPVALDVPHKVRPGQAVTIRAVTDKPLDPSRPTIIHVWAVDEGILLTTAHKTPDPHQHFFGLRKAGVTTGDVFSDLLPDYQRPAGTSRIGGDGDGDESLRRGTMHAGKFIPALIWQQAVPTSDGQTSFNVTLPNHTGELRWMAVAVDGDRYGSTQQPMTLTQPLLVEASWPRFAAPGDQFQVPVKLFNSSSQPLAVDLSVELNGPVQSTTEPRAMLTVNPGQPVTTWVEVTATSVGSLSHRIVASAATVEDGDLRAIAEGTLSVRSGNPLETVTVITRVQAGETFPIEPPAAILPEGRRMTVSLGAAPSIELRPAIEELLDYPHGCVEQTSSRLFAVLVAEDLLGTDTWEQWQRQRAGDMVRSGLERLAVLQTRSGGLGYWQSEYAPDPWGSAYAAGIVQEALRRGHTVDPRFLDGLTSYLTSRLRSTTDHRPDDNEQAHLCCVLAAFQKPDLSWMTRLSERIDELDAAGRADLAEAWLLTGRRDRAAAALRNDTLNLVVARSQSGRLTSSTSQTARLLTVLLEFDPDHPWIPILVQRLEADRKKGTWRTTFENAIVLGALARYQKRATVDADFQGELRLNEADSPRSFTHKAPISIKLSPEKSISGAKLTSSGRGTIYLAVTTTGISKDAQAAVQDRGLYVRRHWVDRQGKRVDLSKLRPGDLICVAVTLGTRKPVMPETIDVPQSLIRTADLNPDHFDRANDGDLPNVAIVDALPAGVEVENPRLASTGVSPHSGHGEADHVEFLDDRVVIFAPAGARTRTFWYALRVTNPGIFTLPPIQAACTYNPDVSSIHGSGDRVTVQRAASVVQEARIEGEERSE